MEVIAEVREKQGHGPAYPLEEEVVVEHGKALVPGKPDPFLQEL